MKEKENMMKKVGNLEKALIKVEACFKSGDISEFEREQLEEARREIPKIIDNIIDKHQHREEIDKKQKAEDEEKERQTKAALDELKKPYKNRSNYACNYAIQYPGEIGKRRDEAPMSAVFLDEFLSVIRKQYNEGEHTISALYKLKDGFEDQVLVLVMPDNTNIVLDLKKTLIITKNGQQEANGASSKILRYGENKDIEAIYTENIPVSQDPELWDVQYRLMPKVATDIEHVDYDRYRAIGQLKIDY